MSKETIEYRAENGETVEITLDTERYPVERVNIYLSRKDGGVDIFQHVPAIPPVEEPTGVGAVIRARWIDFTDYGVMTFIRTPAGEWLDEEGDTGTWNQLKDIEIKAEGWVDDKAN